jgi:hypothetical protein
MNLHRSKKSEAGAIIMAENSKSLKPFEPDHGKACEGIQISLIILLMNNIVNINEIENKNYIFDYTSFMSRSFLSRIW